MSAEKNRGGKSSMVMFEEAGQFPNVDLFKNLVGEDGPYKWITVMDSHQDLTKKYERRKLNTGY